MDKEKIQELKERKQLLKEELRLKKLRERVAPQLAHLEKFGRHFNIYYDYENLNWINSNVQVRNRDGYSGIHDDFQIDVNDSKVEDNNIMREVDINSDKFVEQFLSLIPENTSLIICHQGGDPELEISVEAFLSHPMLYFSNPETWILTTDRSWIVEYIWDQGLIRFIQLQKSKPTLVKKIKIEYE
jgi:hypothetical protein